MPPFSAEPIAVIGSGCRFPGHSSSPSKLWDLLSKPKDVVSRIPHDRFDPSGVYHPDALHHGTTNVKESYFLQENIRQFDAGFFGIKPVEAHSMDPQQRILLEVVYEGLESAGIPLEKLSGTNTAVFVGQMTEDWGIHLRRDPDQVPTYTATGTARSILSNRISYFFDWHGPSVTIDTACSSSLVAVHNAVQALRNGEAPVAVAAGANLIITHELYVAESKLKMLSPNSRSRMWDADADGYARGEGVASIIMKPFSAAIRDGDHIEYIIRETAVNQDGRTVQGITMPSATAQAELIRTAYRRAGLDCRSERDMCQYFEAHGTGTQAGDPQEAQAISEAFFDRRSTNNDRRKHPLYVGSIKTVIGHTESTAGMAGLMKAGLAVQSGKIAPNLLFNKLSDSVAPYYDGLQIPTELTDWPTTLDGVRRASINSFGFGGTNAHAIIESYSTRNYRSAPGSTDHRLFTFSAASQISLALMLAEYSSFLKAHPNTDSSSLSYTLHSHRTEMLCKIAIPADSTLDLASKIDDKLALAAKDTDSALGVRSNIKKSKLLGVFTGQGAQWTAMGRHLVKDFAHVRQTLDMLDQSLARLPPADRPSWSIREQLLVTDPKESRLNEADLSQPLCTAIQIALVDLLQSVGVSFGAVLGHSSGEIAAAYVSGFINASDAIRVAYYRGLCAKRASTQRVIPGAMMAVGTTFEDAEELCQIPELEGRICIAASNSEESITISGDADAIDEAKSILDDEKKFARKLKVDTAYHSHHMQICAEPYVKALEDCDIQIQKGRSDCIWFSSVDDGAIVVSSYKLRSQYWKENMVRPVMFSQALTSALLECTSFDAIVELGPHPALQGPASQTVQSVCDKKIPYTGLLKRNQNDTESLLAGLGFVWAHCGKSSIDIAALDRIIDPSFVEPTLLKNLPSYPWDHTKSYWTESRISKAFDSRSEPIHGLLGVRISDADGEIRFKNCLQIRELPWVTGHQLQGQAVFPAAAYIVAVLESARHLVKGRQIKLLEIQDMSIGRAIILDEGNESGIETLLTLTTAVGEDDDVNTFNADFRFSSAGSADSESLALNASGRLQVICGKPAADTLPERERSPPNMVEVEEDLFYSNLTEVGYQYSGPFRALSSLKRSLGRANGLVTHMPEEGAGGEYLVHPSMLDAAIQSILLAFQWPGDGSLRELHVPTSIDRLRVNPFFCLADDTRTISFPFESATAERRTALIRGDVDIFPEIGFNSAIQLEGLTVKPFVAATAATDRRIFSTWRWNVAWPDAEVAVGGDRPSDHDKLVASATEQAAVYYLKNLKKVVSKEEFEKSAWHHQHLLAFADHVLDGVANGSLPFGQKKWLDTTKEQLYDDIIPSIGDSIEMRLVRAVGENLPDAVRGKTQILEHMLQDNLLNDFYVQGRGIQEHTRFLANMVDQIVHRYSDMNILEIGAGTGGATKMVFEKIGHAFKSWTFTDISTGFFEKAAEVFAEHRDQMIFKALDCEKDIESQGYVKHSYDMVVASLVLHATESLEHTLKNVRELLKPGGFLVMLEMSPSGPIRFGFCMSGLPGWWLGQKDGRKFSPLADPTRWDTALKASGFAGVDAVTSDTDLFERPCFVLASQAVDDRVEVLRNPLSTPASLHPQEVILLGGAQTEVKGLVSHSRHLLESCGIKATEVKDFRDLLNIEIAPNTAVLSLTELDKPIFQEPTHDTIEGLKKLLSESKTILWVTRGRRAQEPYMNMTLGFSRTMALELPLLTTQFFDVDQKGLQPQMVVESLLRLNNLEHFQADSSQSPILWSQEPELDYKDGSVIVPRLRHMDAANQRYNSFKRAIKANKNQQLERIELISTPKGHVPVESAILARKDTKPSHVHIQVSYSSSHAVRVRSTAYYFVIYGTEVKSGIRYVGLSTKNCSVVEVADRMTVALDIPTGHEAFFIQSVVAELLADFITSLCAPHQVLHLHEPAPVVTSAVQQWGQKRQLTISFSTSDRARQSDLVSYIHPRATKLAFRSVLPQRTSCLADFSRGDQATLAASMSNALSSTCLRLGTDDFLSSEIDFTSGQHASGVEELLRISVSNSKQKPFVKGTEVIELHEIESLDSKVDPLSIVDWLSTARVAASIQPIDSAQLFSSEKTYVLFGLTSDLAQSLCYWMVEHGASHIVMTSRSPKVEEQWLQKLRGMGATIKIYANDITNEQSLRNICDEIAQNMPPIGGVADGAMVLADTMITDLSLDTWERVVRPKVLGSIYLDRIFSDTPLEFFILFSSIAAIYGNEGQSNYGAANMYLTSLAYQRRQRGFNASVIHIGPITGAGYITREASDNILGWVQSHGHCLLSQHDFFAGFAEAMLAGNLELGLSPEVVLDERFRPGKEWPRGTDPKFQFTIPKEAGVGSAISGSSNTVSARAGLVEVTTIEEAFGIIKDAFFVKLQALLQHEGSDTWQAESIDRGANELGIDSLISVDLRTWFLKELDVDMPALKILGGASIREMLEYALEKLPRDMMPRLSSDSHVAKNKAVAAEVPAMKEIVEAERPQETQSSSASGSAEDERSTDSSAKSQTSEVTPANLSDVEESGEFAHKLSQVVRTEELSFGQARFWTLMSLMKNPTALNIGCLVKLTGDLRISDLERAMHTVGQRHEALRTRFFTDEDDRTWQGVLGESTISFEKKDISTEALAFQEFEEIKQTLFDLESGQVMRVVLLSLSPSCNYLIILYHHIALDGVSLEIFLADLQQSYNGKPLATKVLQYPEYSKKQRQAAITGLFDPELEFWKKELAHIPPPLPLLPFSNASVRQVLSDYDFNSVDYRVDRALTTRIKMACQKHRATPFHFYFATLSILISRLLSIDEFCIGTADANRMDIETMTSVGNYLNLLPIRLTPKRSQAFAEAMQEVREKAFAALANSKIPFDLLLEKLHFQRSALHSPIFQAFINYRQGVRETRMFGDAKAEAQAYLIAKTGYDISLDIIDNPGGDSTISFMVQKGLYSEKDAASLMSMYVRLLDAFSKKPTANINLPSLHSKEDLDKVLQLGRGKPTAKPEYPTVIQRVDHMIEEHPTRAALRDSTGLQYSYDQMARRVNALASRLIAIGFASQSRIAVLQEPSIDWVCCMLAIMRIGATYVPLDTRLPTLRLETIAQDCSPAAILVHNPTIEAASKLGLADTQIVNASDIAQSFGEKMPNQASPEDVAAILYTSGSTGEPKGILLGHEGIANEIEDSAETFELGPEDKVLQQSAVSFDMSIWQTFNALGNGGMLYVVSKQHRIDPVSISSIIGKEGISVTNGTPSEYLCWLRDGLVDDLKNSSWRLAVAGGEQVTQTHMKEFSALGKRGLQFFNGYGPTEVTIVSSKANLDYSELAEVSCDENYPVGHTTRNCSVYIVDSSLQLLPACHSGEILVGGPGVAHGYLNERLTKEKFMPDTFASQDQVSRGWMKMYKTGDRGYLRPDGALVVESRIVGDTEIKLRGIRIDVQDVEKAIVRASKGAILRAIVSVRGDPQFLVAHVVLGPQVPKEELRAFWLTLVGTLPLPQYMCPALALSLDELPLTGHGKVDRQAISALPLDEELGSKPKEQWNDEDLPEVQSRLRNLWVELLPNGKSQKKAIGPESDFFYSGGNSGLLVRLQRAIREHFDVIIPLAELFEASTLRQMGVYVENHTTHSHIDWDIETSFDRDTIAQEASRLLELVSPSNSKSEGKVIMLTGATGNLGSSVLPLLSQRTDVAKIHCVAVRDLGKLEEIEKIVVHPGDLTKSRLGLGEVEFATLAANVDVIIHCGAARSFWDYYHTLRNVNVSSAKELVLLAAGRKIPIHFLSSGGAAAIGRDSAKPLESLKDIQPQTDGSDGYVSSKWAAEQIFESAAERFGIPVAIYRTLPADAQKATAAQKVAALETFMEFSKLLSSLPSDDGWEGKMDLLPLKNFAEAIVANATSVERGATDNTIATYSNHEASIQVDMEELAAYVEANLDAKSLGEFERVQAIEWVGMAKKAGFPLMFASQSLTFTAPGAKKGLELRR